jgi:HAD superfamily hydrolase (TIGR01549 family)
MTAMLFATSAAHANTFLLRPAAVFDGDQLHPGWTVLVTGDKIAATGPATEITAPPGASTIDLPNDTLIPGMIEGHSHLFLHPYDETSWNDQVNNESLAFRTARATAHAKQTLLAGFTTVRDLGTEGAGYGDVGLKKALEQGIVPGPRMIVVTRAIVATGSYGPKLSTDLDLPQGAQEASGVDEIVRVAREQIGKGADQLLPVFFSNEELSEFGVQLEEYRAELFKQAYLPRVTAFPKVRELFRKLVGDGNRIVLASSGSKEEIAHYKKLARIEDLVAAETSADDVERSKPYPDIFAVALSRLGINNDEALVVGDTPYDAEAASGAGTAAAGVLSGGFAEEAYDPPTNALPFGHVRPKAKKSNDYLIDWQLHQNRRFGIAGVNLQDVCVTENEGPAPILDRTKETLCAGDSTIIKARLMHGRTLRPSSSSRPMMLALPEAGRRQVAPISTNTSFSFCF